MNSLNHLLLPDHLPPCVSAQMSNPSPVFLALLTPNQRRKTTFFFSGASRMGRCLYCLSFWLVEVESHRWLCLALRRLSLWRARSDGWHLRD